MPLCAAWMWCDRGLVARHSIKPGQRVSSYLCSSTLGKSQITSRFPFKGNQCASKNSTIATFLSQGCCSKCCRLYGNAAFFHLQQSVESGLLQFYRHRQEPVPWINRVKHGRLFRRPKPVTGLRALRGGLVWRASDSFGISEAAHATAKGFHGFPPKPA
jgi:hypothetical protein